MKFLHTAFQNMKAPFEKGGKFEKYDKALTAIDAFETLMFTPESSAFTTVMNSPSPSTLTKVSLSVTPKAFPMILTSRLAL